MNKKLLIIALTALSAGVLATAIAGCTDKNQNNLNSVEHVCVYDVQNTSDEYLVSEADCTHKAVYLYSCECGAVGYETFEYGDFNHVFDKQSIQNKFLKSPADCTHKAEYYYSCECGNYKGEETFEYGDYRHVYDKEIVKDEYLKSPADCTHKAMYYYSCECGKKGGLTFGYGEPTAHTFTRQTVDERYLKSAANCTHKAQYYYSCADCGKEGEETFEVGETVQDAHVFFNGDCKFCHTPQIIPLKYKLNDDGASYGVVGCDKACPGYTIIIPSTYEGKPVTAICEEALSLELGIKNVTIPDSVTSIGKNAFAFCRTLETVNFGSGLEGIGDFAFYGCRGLKSLTLPQKVKSIGNYAFAYCEALEKLEIPDGLTYFGQSVLQECKKLNYNIYDNALYLGNATTPHVMLIKASSKTISSCDIAATTKIICRLAFAECSYLKSIVIPDGVTAIEHATFTDCNALKKVTFGANVKSIGTSAFSSVEEVYYNGDIAGWCGIEGLENLISLFAKTKIYIGGSIPEGDITIPVGATKIPARAFYRCTGITSVSIPSTVKSIGEWAFGYCGFKQSVSIPDGVKSIDRCAFSDCKSLKTVSIPDSVTKIDEYAFDSCDKLQFNEYGGARYLGNAQNLYHALIGATANTLSEAEINQNAKVICPLAFRNCDLLESIVIPASVVWVGEKAFESCDGLQSITVEAGNAVYHSDGNCIIETKSKTLIAGCKATVIPKDGSVTAIGNYAFRVISTLTEIIIPDGITEMGEYAFADCTSLTEIVLPEGIEEISDSAFYYCTSLEKINIPESVTSLEKCALTDCSSLTDITYKGTKEKWNRVYKGYAWDRGTGDYTVHCTDGDIQKSN